MLTVGNAISVYLVGDKKVYSDTMIKFEHPQAVDAPALSATDRSPAPINALRIGYLGSQEILVAVDDAGLVMVYNLYPEAPIEEVFRIKGTKSTLSGMRSPLILKNDISTWSIALNRQRRHIAVGANNHKIRIWKLSVEEAVDQSDRDHFDIDAHDHNIPTLDYSSCGRFLVSGSVDGSVRIWDACNDYKMVGNISLRDALYQNVESDQTEETDSYVWGVRCLDFDNVPSIAPNSHVDEEEIRKHTRDRPSRVKQIVYQYYKMALRLIQETSDSIDQIMHHFGDHYDSKVNEVKSYDQIFGVDDALERQQSSVYCPLSSDYKERNLLIMVSLKNAIALITFDSQEGCLQLHRIVNNALSSCRKSVLGLEVEHSDDTNAEVDPEVADLIAEELESEDFFDRIDFVAQTLKYDRIFFSEMLSGSDGVVAIGGNCGAMALYQLVHRSDPESGDDQFIFFQLESLPKGLPEAEFMSGACLSQMNVDVDFKKVKWNLITINHRLSASMYEIYQVVNKEK
ncbi:hypothetical protein MIR68_012573 [Amoeboaphelidium protococcarum]|nr:hypothetical protein MIR68_012573 [Amoeboaphelidium protococcarum]